MEFHFMRSLSGREAEKLFKIIKKLELSILENRKVKVKPAGSNQRPRRKRPGTKTHWWE